MSDTETVRCPCGRLHQIPKAIDPSSELARVTAQNGAYRKQIDRQVEEVKRLRAENEAARAVLASSKERMARQAELEAEVERLKADLGAGLGPEETVFLTSENAALKAEVERLSELLWGARCVYCGEVVGKERKNQDLGDADLRAHIEACPNHPVAALKAEVERLKAALDDIRNHVCLPSEPSAISMRKLADKALTGGRE
jgi:regulator of replication initiation timing